MNIAKLTIILISMLLCVFPLFGQDACGCYNCPDKFPAETDTFLLYHIDGVQNNSLETNSLREVKISFSTDEIGDLELVLQSPVGQFLQLTGADKTARQTLLSSWNISFVDCDLTVAPDPGIPPKWSNNSNWLGFTNYSGSYRPSGGCLSNFNSNQINGIWTLYVSDFRGNGSNRNISIFDFDLIFEDETGRIPCFECDVPTPAMSTDSLVACFGTDALLLDTATNNGSDSIWFLVQNDTILAKLQQADLRTFPKGYYEFYQFNYYPSTQHFIQGISTGVPISVVQDSLKKRQQNYCGALSAPKHIQILDNQIDSQTITLCAGDSIVRTIGSPIKTAGIFFDTLSTECSAIVRYEVSLAQPDTTTIDSSACGNRPDTSIFIPIQRVEACDSVIKFNISYFPTYSFTFEEPVCELPEITERTEFLKSVHGCDSLLTTRFIQKQPDTVRITDTICAASLPPPDTTTVQGFCDTIFIKSYEVRQQDTIEYDSIRCGIGNDTLWFEQMDTTACAQTLQITLTYRPSYLIIDTINSCTAATGQLSIDTFQTMFGCDSFVIKQFINSSIDTTWDTSYICKGTVSEADTILLEGQNGCDSVVVRLEEKLVPPKQEVDSIICTDAIRRDTALLRTLSTSDGCDSLVQINLLYKPIFESIQKIDSCGLVRPFSDTLFLTSIYGCDSLLIDKYEPIAPDTLRDTLINCDVQTSFFDTNMVTIDNCPAVLISWNIAAWIAPTLITDTVCTDLPLPDTSRYTSNVGCDSLVVTNFVYRPPFVEPKDTVVCGEGKDTTIQVYFHRDSLGCDSSILYTFRYEAPVQVEDTSYVCTPASVRLDTQYLQTTLGCDSIHIRHYILAAIDTIENRIPVCTAPGMPDTLFQNTGALCPNVVINTFFDARDTTRLQISTCDSMDLEPDTLIQNNMYGCDSLIIRSKTLAPSFSFTIDSFICSPPRAPEMLRYQTRLGCDSIYTIRFISRQSDTTFLENETCPPVSRPADTIRLINQFGCDSVVVRLTSSAVKATVRDTVPVCRLPGGQRTVNTYFGGETGCDTLLITTYSPIPPRIINQERYTCNPDSADVITNVNSRDTIGCRQTTRTRYIYRAPIQKVDTLYTCGIVRPDSIAVFSYADGCDSLLWRFVFEPTQADTTYQSINVCNAIQALDTTLYFTNRLGCDSVVIINQYYIEPITTFDTVWTCNPEEVNTQRLVTQTIGGCDSLVTFNVTALKRSDFVRDTTYSCDIDQSIIVFDTLVNQVGCDSIVQRFVMPDTTLRHSIRVRPVSCHGQSNGRVLLNIQKGVQVRWEDGSTSPERFDLDTGQYKIILSSATCDTALTVRISQPQPLALDIKQTSTNCIENSGVLQAIVTGGSRPYRYNWSNKATQPIIQNIGAGTYILQVVDSMGCMIVDTVSYRPIVAPNVQIKVRHVSCAGNRDGQITFEVPLSDAKGSLTYLLNGVSRPDTAFTNLRPGVYSITIRNENDCALNRVIEILEPDSLQASVNIRKRLDETFDLSAQTQGGTPPYTYLWHNGSKNPTITQSNADKYAVEIKDFNGCRLYLDSSISTSNETIKKDVLEVYPNPTSQNLYVNFEGFGNLFPLKWVIVSIDGKMLIDGTIQKAGIIEIPTEYLPAGAYIFKAHHPNVIFVNQIIKIN